MRPMKAMKNNESVKRGTQVAVIIALGILLILAVALAITTSSLNDELETLKTPVEHTYTIHVTYANNDTTAETIETVETPEIKQETQYYDVPLSSDLQDYIFSITEEYSVPVEVVIALIKTESNYNPDAVGSAGEQGYMQIHPINFKELSEKFGVTDFLDSEQNILCGVYMLSELYNKYSTMTEVLMCYNCGERKAKELWTEGIVSTTYTVTIDATINSLELREAE